MSKSMKWMTLTVCILVSRGEEYAIRSNIRIRFRKAIVKH